VALPQRLSRRALLRSAFLGSSGVLAAYLAGCADGGDGQATPAPTPTLARPTAVPRPTAAPSVLGWQLISPNSANPPQPRRDHSLTTNGVTLYVFGGRSGSEELSDSWGFSANVWTSYGTEGPSPRHGHNAIWDAARDRIIVFGGQQESSFLDDIWEFDTRSNEWRQLPQSGSGPAPRYGAGGAFDAAGDRMLVTHGFTNAGRFDDTWQYDLVRETWTDISPQGARPIERCLMRAVWDSSRERLLMFGGQTTGTAYLGDLWALEEGGWRQITADPSPAPRNFYSFVFDDEAGRAILFGGSTQDGPADDLWQFDSASETWERQEAGAGPSPRFGHDAVWRPDTRSLLVFGGNDGSTDLNDMWELSVPL